MVGDDWAVVVGGWVGLFDQAGPDPIAPDTNALLEPAHLPVHPTRTRTHTRTVTLGSLSQYLNHSRPHYYWDKEIKGLTGPLIICSNSSRRENKEGTGGCCPSYCCDIETCVAPLLGECWRFRGWGLGFNFGGADVKTHQRTNERTNRAVHDLKNNSMDMSFKNTQTEVKFPNPHIHTQVPTQTTNHIPHGVRSNSTPHQSLNGSFEINTWGNGTNGFPRGVFVMALYRDFDKPLWGGMYVCM